MGFSRILLLSSLPSCVLSAGNYAPNTPQTLAKFKEEYTKERQGDLDTSLKILQYNNAIRGSATPTYTDSAPLWQWYHSDTGAIKVEAQKFLEQVEKDNLVHEQALASMLGEVKKVLAGGATETGIKQDAANLKLLVGSTLPVAGNGPPKILADTVNTWNSLKDLSAATRKTVLDHAWVMLYDNWAAVYDAKMTDLKDYASITKGLAEMLGKKAPGDNTAYGQTNQPVYFGAPTALQSKMRAFFLAKLKAKM